MQHTTKNREFKLARHIIIGPAAHPSKREKKDNLKSIKKLRLATEPQTPKLFTVLMRRGDE